MIPSQAQLNTAASLFGVAKTTFAQDKFIEQVVLSLCGFYSGPIDSPASATYSQPTMMALAAARYQYCITYNGGAQLAPFVKTSITTGQTFTYDFSWIQHLGATLNALASAAANNLSLHQVLPS